MIDKESEDSSSVASAGMPVQGVSAPPCLYEEHPHILQFHSTIPALGSKDLAVVEKRERYTYNANHCQPGS